MYVNYLAPVTDQKTCGVGGHPTRSGVQLQSKCDENLHDETPRSGIPSAPTSCEKKPRCWKETRPYMLKQTAVVTRKRRSKMITHGLRSRNITMQSNLVGGLNPSEKYESQLG